VQFLITSLNTEWHKKLSIKNLHTNMIHQHQCYMLHTLRTNPNSLFDAITSKIRWHLITTSKDDPPSWFLIFARETSPQTQRKPSLVVSQRQNSNVHSITIIHKTKDIQNYWKCPRNQGHYFGCCIDSFRGGFFARPAQETETVSESCRWTHTAQNTWLQLTSYQYTD
jgi:hypothetical protein